MEKDKFQDECEKLKERLDMQLNQITKSQREKADIETELDVLKERWEKAHMLQVSSVNQCCHIVP